MLLSNPDVRKRRRERKKESERVKDAEREKARESEREIETARQRERETEREKERDREREKDALPKSVQSISQLTCVHLVCVTRRDHNNQFIIAIYIVI